VIELRNIAVLTDALEIVEERLCEPMNAADLAKSCYASCSGLQKLFSYAFGCPVSEYITKRRLSRASRELLTSGKSITQIALDYQYGSPEAFSRAFRRFWGIPPSEFRKTRRFTELFPKFIVGGPNMSGRKPMDISELYDVLKIRSGAYVLSIDLSGFEKINDNYGYAAGDAVLAGTFARLESETSDDMLLFRIGGDEFAVITSYTDLTDAEALANRIVARNGEPVKAGEHDVPLTLSIGICRMYGETLNYQKALTVMVDAVHKAKAADGRVAVYSD
jgi:AraC family transcriptional regulator